jgi:hypothetical protein
MPMNIYEGIVPEYCSTNDEILDLENNDDHKNKF